MQEVNCGRPRPYFKHSYQGIDFVEPLWQSAEISRDFEETKVQAEGSWAQGTVLWGNEELQRGWDLEGTMHDGTIQELLKTSRVQC